MKRTICTSVSQRTSTSSSTSFILLWIRSPPFGSESTNSPYRSVDSAFGHLVSLVLTTPRSVFQDGTPVSTWLSISQCATWIFLSDNFRIKPLRILIFPHGTTNNLSFCINIWCSIRKPTDSNIVSMIFYSFRLTLVIFNCREKNGFLRLRCRVPTPFLQEYQLCTTRSTVKFRTRFARLKFATRTRLNWLRFLRLLICLNPTGLLINVNLNIL